MFVYFVRGLEIKEKTSFLAQYIMARLGSCEFSFYLNKMLSWKPPVLFSILYPAT